MNFPLIQTFLISGLHQLPSPYSIIFNWIILVEEPEGKRPLGRPRHGWEANIRIDLREIGWEGVD
jgi:hypothetical protein